MKYVDIENWKRKNHFNFYKDLDCPHFNICGNLDITKFHKYIKENELPFFITFLYVSSKVANDIEEFRLRIREDKVVLHDYVSPAPTVLGEDELFGFCTVDFTERFHDFRATAEKELDKSKKNISLENNPNRDDLLYVTSLPWISFTSVSHPIHLSPVDSIPRIAWGKFFQEGEKIKLPLSVQVHHSLADGLHVGKYFNMIQEVLDNPEKYL